MSHLDTKEDNLRYLGACTKEQLEAFQDNNIIGDAWYVTEADGSHNVYFWDGAEWKRKKIEKQTVLTVKDLKNFLANYKGNEDDILTAWDLDSGERFPIVTIDGLNERKLEFNFQPDISLVEYPASRK